MEFFPLPTAGPAVCAPCAEVTVATVADLVSLNPGRLWRPDSTALPLLLRGGPTPRGGQVTVARKPAAAPKMPRIVPTFSETRLQEKLQPAAWHIGVISSGLRRREACNYSTVIVL